MKPTQSIPSITELAQILRRNAETKRESSARFRANQKEILRLTGGTDLNELALLRPDSARELLTQIAMIQSAMAVDRMVADGLDGQLQEFGPAIIAATDKIIAEIAEISASNCAAVLDYAVAKLRGLVFFEEARLTRIAKESLPVRQEFGHHAGFLGLSNGAGHTCHDGKGGLLYEDLHAVAVVNAFDAASAAVAAVRTRADQIAKKYGR